MKAENIMNMKSLKINNNKKNNNQQKIYNIFKKIRMKFQVIINKIKKINSKKKCKQIKILSL